MEDVITSSPRTTRSLGYDEIFGVPVEDAIKVGMAGFDSSELDQEKVHDADLAWRSLLTTCKGMTFEIVEKAQSPTQMIFVDDYTRMR